MTSSSPPMAARCAAFLFATGACHRDGASDWTHRQSDPVVDTADDTGGDTGAAIDRDGDGYTEEQGDCNDGEPEMHPGAEEVCNGIDDDCDPSTREDESAGARTWHPDEDEDGYGDPGDSVSACDPPEGWVEDGSDCDDSDDDAHPGAPDVCGDGADQDCDGAPDAGCGPSASLGDSDTVVVGLDAGGQVGDILASADDLDGDGLSDLLTGGACVGTDGAVFALAGPVSGSMTVEAAFATVTGTGAPGTITGAAGPGDLDGDGLADLAVVTEWDAHVLLGPVCGGFDLGGSAATFARVDLDADDPKKSGFWEALSLAGPGDLNGDGRDDLVVGDGDYDLGGTNAGAAFVLFGPWTGKAELPAGGYTLFADDDWAFTGLTTAGAGDVDGDGARDLLVGGPYRHFNGGSRGAAWLAYGPVTTDVSLADADARLEGEEANGIAGWAIAGEGDVDGDGLDDVLVGAPGMEEYTGAAYLLHGPVEGDIDLGEADAVLEGEAPFSWAGCSVAIAADSDGDGHADLVVGSPSDSAAGIYAGAAYLLFGPVSGRRSLGTADLKVTGEAVDDRAGTAAADLDGVYVAAPRSDRGAKDGGAVFGVRW